MHALHASDPSRRRTDGPLKQRLSLGLAAACLVLLMQSCIHPTTIESAVYVANLLDGSPQLLGAPAGAPVWAPNGDAVAWASEEGVHLHDLGENYPVLISTRVPAGEPAWSPDGSAIAFIDREAMTLLALDAATGATRFELDVATRDAPHRPLALPVVGGPAWSPDGSRLAYNCWDGHGDEICVARADGSEIRQLTHIQTRRTTGDPPPDAPILAAANAGPPAWSPNGAELALAVYPEQRGAAAGVYVIDLDVGTAQRISTLLPDSKITWVADGESVIFSARDQGRSDVFRAPFTAGEAVRLTAALEHGAREPTVSPEQSQLAVSSNGDLVLLSIDGAVEATLNGAQERLHPAWSPKESSIAFVAAPNPLTNYP